MVLANQKEIVGLICISGTFALGHLVLELNKVLHLPVALWALNELPYDGGKIRLNSLCGVNLNASNLYKAGVKNIHVIIAKKNLFLQEKEFNDSVNPIAERNTPIIKIRLLQKQNQK